MLAASNLLCEIFFSRSSFWIFTFCLFSLWTPVKGSFQLIGPSQPIVAAPGDDAVLPCRVDPEWDAVGKTVEWSRPDLRPSGPQRPVEYVFMYRYKKTERDMMMETYIQRTSLSEGLRRGDVSLSIRNVSLEDNGRFRCYIPSLKMEAEVLLVVDPNFGRMTTTEAVPDRNFISPTQQEEISRNARRSRLFLCCLIIFFIVFLSSVFICYLNKKNCQKILLNQASTLQTGCLAQGLTCVDVEENSMKSSLLQIPQGSDSTQQLQQHGNPGEGTSLCDQSEAYR